VHNTLRASPFLRILTAAAAVIALAAWTPSRREAPTVRIRDFSAETIVAGWAGQPLFGLRTAVPRGSSPVRYHQFWLSASYIVGSAQISKAAAGSRQFPMGGPTADNNNCFADGTCTPNRYYSASVRDDFLRKQKENLAVMFYLDNGTDFTLTVKKDLIDAYLAIVDSVSTANRAK